MRQRHAGVRGPFDEPERGGLLGRQGPLLAVPGEDDRRGTYGTAGGESRHALGQVVDVHDVDPCQRVAPAVRRHHNINTPPAEPRLERHLRRRIDTASILLVARENATDDQDSHD